MGLDGRIANPINKLIEPIVITNPGPWGASNNISTNIQACIKNKSIDCLENLGVQYILYDK